MIDAYITLSGDPSVGIPQTTMTLTDFELPSEAFREQFRNDLAAFISEWFDDRASVMFSDERDFT